MKLFTSLFIAAVLAVPSLTIQPVFAQSGVVDMPPLVINSTPESRQRLANLERIADQAILDYVDRSIRSIQQGQRHGFADFRVYYRKREADLKAQQSTSDLLKSIMESALSAGLNIIFPGAGNFTEKLKDYSKKAYSTIANKLGQIPPGDINRFLDEHEAQLETYITGMLDVRENFRKQHKTDFEDAKTEFIMENAFGPNPSTSTDLGPIARRTLRQMGVPEPGSATANRVRESTLERQILAVFNNEKAMRTFHSAWQRQVLARASAMRHIYPKEPDKYCPHERKLGYFWMSTSCRKWAKR